MTDSKGIDRTEKSLGNHYADLDIRSRLAAVIGTLSVLLIFIGALGLGGMSETNRDLHEVYRNRAMPLTDLGMIIDMANRIRTNAVTAANAPRPEVARRAADDTRVLDGEIDKLWAKYMSAEMPEEEERLADAFQKQWRIYQASRDITLAHALAGDYDAARQNAAEDAGPKFTVARGMLFDLIRLQGDIAGQEYQSAQARYSATRGIAIGVIVAGIALALWLGIGLIRAIVRPLNAAIGHFEQISRGNYNNDIVIEHYDEIGEVMTAIRSMQAKLDANNRSLEASKRLAESALRIFASTSSVAGEEFFAALTRSMQEELGIPHVYIIELPNGPAGAYRVLGASMALPPNLPPVIEWGLAERCMAEGLTAIVEPRDIQALLPNSKWVRAINAEALGVSLLRDSGGELIGLIAVADSVPFADEQRIATLLPLFSARAAMEIERGRLDTHLAHQATHDALTGLPNRLLLNDRLQCQLLAAERRGQRVAVLFIDLDDFKDVNDCFGHDTGDLLLVHIADTLRATLRDEDTVARYGGDEFVVVLGQLDNATDAERVAQKLVAAIARPIDLNEQQQQFHCKASIGIALYPEHGGDAPTLLRNADTALYRAKDTLNQQYRLFTSDMNADLVRRIVLEDQLRLACGRDEIGLHYQPQIDLASGRIVGVEALLRWQHPHRGAVSPAEFVPIAEACGLIIDLGDWAIERACRDLALWRRQGHEALRLAVNISPRQFESSAIYDTIISTLGRHGIPHECFEIELTESLLIANPASTKELLHAFREQNISISMDDFGTGYSSLSYLKQYPIQRLKIDRSFVRDIADDPNDAALVQAIIAMSNALGIAVIAEGIETQEQCGRLVEWGCDEAQGYYFGRPAPAEKIGELLAELSGNSRPHSFQI